MIENILKLLEQYIANGNGAAYIIAFLGGILVSFTPCVYPLIPITIAYLGARGGTSKARNFFLALFYVIGMAGTYSVLGAIAALSGRVFGRISTSPWTYLAFGNICIILGLSVLNVFYLPIPKFLKARQMPTQKKGFFSSFLVGVASGIVLGPCTAPVMAILLAFVAARSNVFFGCTLLFSFAMGTGMLLLLIGTFAGILVRLPKSGAWLMRIEKSLGWLLIFIGECFIFMAGRWSV